MPGTKIRKIKAQIRRAASGRGCGESEFLVIHSFLSSLVHTTPTSNTLVSLFPYKKFVTTLDLPNKPRGSPHFRTFSYHTGKAPLTLMSDVHRLLIMDMFECYYSTPPSLANYLFLSLLTCKLRIFSQKPIPSPYQVWFLRMFGVKYR